MQNSTRISLDQMFLDIAETVSKRSTCPRLNVGSVIVKDKRAVSIGYNGTPPGEPHCIDVGCTLDSGCASVVHAEANAIVWAARAGISTSGTTIYSTHEPCYECSKLIASSGIINVVFRAEYKRRSGVELLKKLGIEVKHVVG